MNFLLSISMVLTWSLTVVQSVNTGCFFEASVVTNTVVYCSDQDDRIVVGDFNGDSKSDLLCHHRLEEEIEFFHNLQTRKKQEFHFCLDVKSKLMAADFNGDKRFDLLCVTYNGDDKIEKMALLLANEKGEFNVSKAAGKVINFCNGKDSGVVLGDYNGDNRTDIICKIDGSLEVTFASNNGGFRDTVSLDMNFCNSGTLHSGYFNNDGKSDLLCYMNNGDAIISIARADGLFKRVAWQKKINLCSMDRPFILVSDINNDGFDDLICKDTKTAYVAKNIQNQYFRDTPTNKFVFCLGGKEKNVFVGDFNGDKHYDLLCQSRDGKRQIFVSHC